MRDLDVTSPLSGAGTSRTFYLRGEPHAASVRGESSPKGGGRDYTLSVQRTAQRAPPPQTQHASAGFMFLFVATFLVWPVYAPKSVQRSSLASHAQVHVSHPLMWKAWSMPASFLPTLSAQPARAPVPGAGTAGRGPAVGAAVDGDRTWAHAQHAVLALCHFPVAASRCAACALPHIVHREMSSWNHWHVQNGQSFTWKLRSSWHPGATG